MKHQYVGDINDYRKYALLRALSDEGRNKIGVCWMLTPSDDSMDGNKLRYLSKPEQHRHFDPELFDILGHAASEPDRRRLQTIENSEAIAGAVYFNALLSDNAADRQTFMQTCAYTFRDVDLMFFDPDNGLEVSIPKGRKNSSKYLYLDEVAAFYSLGRSLLIYQHFPRIERTAFLRARAEQLHTAAPDCSIWAFSTAHVVFFLLVHSNSPARVAEAVTRASKQWESDGFIRSQRLTLTSAQPDN